jgi:hypothetical protein
MLSLLGLSIYYYVYVSSLYPRFACELYQSLGFDWLFLFMHATIHMETVVRAVRILVQMLADSQLRQHFLNGKEGGREGGRKGGREGGVGRDGREGGR